MDSLSPTALTNRPLGKWSKDVAWSGWEGKTDLERALTWMFVPIPSFDQYIIISSQYDGRGGMYRQISRVSFKGGDFSWVKARVGNHPSLRRTKSYVRWIDTTHRDICDFHNRPRFTVLDVDCVVVEACQKLGFRWVEIGMDDFRYVTVLYSRLKTHVLQRLRISYKGFAGMTADAR